MSILQMQRRELIAGLGSTAAWPLVARAQQAGKIYRIGYFWLGAQPPDPQKTQPWPTLRKLGYVEGSNLVVERRFAAGRRDRLAAFASELVSLKPDVILAHGGQAAEAANQTTHDDGRLWRFAKEISRGRPSSTRPTGPATCRAGRSAPWLRRFSQNCSFVLA